MTTGAKEMSCRGGGGVGGGWTLFFMCRSGIDVISIETSRCHLSISQLCCNIVEFSRSLPCCSEALFTQVSQLRASYLQWRPVD